MIDPAKPYRVANSYTGVGTAVRVLANDAVGDFPIVALMPDGSVTRLTASGHLRERDRMDGREPFIVERKPRVQRTVWVNVYRARQCEMLDDRGEADQAACIDRVACIRMDLDVEEGEGL